MEMKKELPHHSMQESSFLNLVYLLRTILNPIRKTVANAT